MRPVRVQEIVLGQTLAADVTNIHGQVILPTGSVLGRHQRTLLKAWGIVEVQVCDDEGVAPTTAEIVPTKIQPTPGAITEEDRHPALVELAEIVARIGRNAGPSEIARLRETVEMAVVSKSESAAWSPISAETVAGRARTLVSLPTIYLQVETAIKHPSSSSTDIANVLRSDQGLCARLLRIANSAFYGFPRRVEGVDEAIRIIGTRQLHDLVLATVVLTQFRGVDAHLVTMKSFWEHSFACGIAARTMASLRREDNIERFFVGGLLHDIGSLVIYQEFPKRAAVALEEHRKSNLALEEAERSSIGCDHGQVGAALMKLWKLPDFYREAAAYHHNPRNHSIAYQSPSVGTSVVHLADVVVNALGLGSNGEVAGPRFCAEAWDLVGLTPANLGRVAEEVVTLVKEALRLFVDE
jgi:HD-like signal output (HDOD) protein